MANEKSLSDRDLLLILERVPENFVIGKDSFGWWYSINGGTARILGFSTATAALFHFSNYSML